MDLSIQFKQFFEQYPRCVIVKVEQAKGSTPRDEGTVMLVSETAVTGTIGGGQLEFIAIDHARNILAGSADKAQLDIPLGPDIGQCCGGRMMISFQQASTAARSSLIAHLTNEAGRDPSVFIFGAGHVGTALAHALTPLPFNTTLVETRRDMIKNVPRGTKHRLSAMPEAEISSIPNGGAAIIVTHDHALDFIISTEALKQGNLSYCGMIGSKTKRATFHNFAREQGINEQQLTQLTMPIGGSSVKDKRPALIAALVACELIHILCATKAGGQDTETATGQYSTI